MGLAGCKYFVIGGIENWCLWANYFLIMWCILCRLFLEHSYYWLLGMSVRNIEQGNCLAVVKVLRRSIRELYLLVHLALPSPSYWLANFSIQQITGQTLPTYSHCVTCFENVSYSTWPVTTATCYFATSGTTLSKTQNHIPEDQSPQLHCCENLSTHKVLLSFDVFFLPIDLLLQFLVFH